MTASSGDPIIRGNPHPEDVFCMHDYTPWWAYREEGRTEDATVHDLDVMNMKPRNNGTDRQKASISRVAGEIAEILSPPVTVVVVPPSNPDTPISGLHEVAKALSIHEGVEDGAVALKRIAPKDAAHRGGDRSVDANLDTLSVDSPEMVVGRRILLLDDMSKTGNTGRAARQLLLDAGATQVEVIAIGCTAGATARE